MAHNCPECEELCYCDMEDHYQQAPDDCSHECKDEAEYDETDDE